MNGFQEDARTELRAAYYAKNGDPDLFDKWLTDRVGQEAWLKQGILLHEYRLQDILEPPPAPAHRVPPILEWLGKIAIVFAVMMALCAIHYYCVSH